MEFNISEIQGSISNKKLGLISKSTDKFTSSYFQILLRNTFSVINIVLFPLLGILFFFQLYLEIFVFSTFLFVNTVVSIIDEIRAKRKLERLKNEFQQDANVIRNGKVFNTPISEIVEEEIIIAKEGESIITDGVILDEYYLQVDESMLTGESNYIEKDRGDLVKSGSFIVTGKCIYQANKLKDSGFISQISQEATHYKKKSSKLQRNGNRLIIFLVVSAIVVSLINFLSTSDYDFKDRILSITTLISLIIPQTLILLFTLTFTISITKLFAKGIVIQKGSSIEELANIDIICFDKTGTLTTNKMEIKYVKSFNTDIEEVGIFYNSIKDNIVSVNETQKLIHEYFATRNKKNFTEFDQIPFTSKNKYSLISASLDGKNSMLILGASSVLVPKINETLRDSVAKYIQTQEVGGYRVLVCGFVSELNTTLPKSEILNNLVIDSIIIFSIEEELNLGIKDLFTDLKKQSIDIKIISGDSKSSVARIAGKLGFDLRKIYDLSENNIEDLEKVIEDYQIFTRAKPEDKVRIVNALQRKNHKVAMVGDGINDVLALKNSDVSIAMESGSKITREISDIVLLKNDYRKIPVIFFEGENILFNLKISTKLFLMKAFFAIFVGIFASLMTMPLFWYPTSTLIFGFLGSSAVGYIVIFTRQRVHQSKSFFREVLKSSLTSGIIIAFFLITIFFIFRNSLSFIEMNTLLVISALSMSIIYSIVILFEAGKIRKLVSTIPIYLVIILLGIFQTILPPFQEKYDLNGNLNIYLLMILTFLIALSFVVFVAKVRRKKYMTLFFVASLILVIVGSIFPFQSYYNTTNLDLSYILIALSITLIAGQMIYLTHQKHLFKLKKD